MKRLTKEEFMKLARKPDFYRISCEAAESAFAVISFLVARRYEDAWKAMSL